MATGNLLAAADHDGEQEEEAAPVGDGIVAIGAVLVNGRQDFPLHGDGGVLWLV